MQEALDNTRELELHHNAGQEVQVDAGEQVIQQNAVEQDAQNPGWQEAQLNAGELETQQNAGEQETQQNTGEQETRQNAGEQEAQQYAEEEGAQQNVGEQDAQQDVGEHGAQQNAGQQDVQQNAGQQGAQQNAGQQNVQQNAGQQGAQQNAQQYPPGVMRQIRCRLQHVKTHIVQVRPISWLKENPNVPSALRNMSPVSSVLENNTDPSARPSQESVQSSLHIEMLPAEVLLLIFTYCDPHDFVNIAQVCRRWEALSQRTSIRKRLTFRRNDHVSLEEAYQRMSNVSDLSDLHLIGRNDVVPLIQHATQTNRNLRSLTVRAMMDDFPEKEMVPHVLHGILKETDLRELTVKNCRVTMFTRTDFSILCCDMKNLRKLNLNFIQELQYEDLGKIVRYCPRLEDLRLLACDTSARPYLRLRDLDVMVIVGLFETLQVLKINANYVSDVGMNLLTSCDKLRKLCLRNLRHVCGNGLLKLASLTRLRSLSLTCADRPTATQWLTLMSKKNWPNLRKLALVSCSFGNEAAYCVSENYRHLRSLNVSGCNNLTVQGVKVIIDNSKFLEEVTLCLSQIDGCIYWIPPAAPLIKRIIYHSCYEAQGPHRELYRTDLQSRSRNPGLMDSVLLVDRSHR